MPASIAGIAAGPDGRTGSAVDDLGNVELLSPFDDHRFRSIPAASAGSDPSEAPICCTVTTAAGSAPCARPG